MGKFVIKVTRELEDTFVGVMDFDTSKGVPAPLKEDIVKWLSTEHYIDDDPDYTKYEVVEHIM